MGLWTFSDFLEIRRNAMWLAFLGCKTESLETWPGHNKEKTFNCSDRAGSESLTLVTPVKFYTPSLVKCP